MKIQAHVHVPGRVEDVFDFLADPANTVALGGHAAEHVGDIVEVAKHADGRRTFDLTMRAGPRKWTQTIEQTVLDRPHRLASRGWTWVDRRADAYLIVTTDRILTPEADGTRLSMTVEYTPNKRPLLGRVLGLLQRGQVQLEIDHQLHFLAERFVARDIRRP